MCMQEYLHALPLACACVCAIVVCINSIEMHSVDLNRYIARGACVRAQWLLNSILFIVNIETIMILQSFA